MILKVSHVQKTRQKEAILKACTPHSLRTHYLTYTFCFSSLRKRLASLDGWARVAKPLFQFFSPWLNPLNSSSAPLRWQSLARCSRLPVQSYFPSFAGRAWRRYI